MPSIAGASFRAASPEAGAGTHVPGLLTANISRVSASAGLKVPPQFKLLFRVLSESSLDYEDRPHTSAPPRPDSGAKPSGTFVGAADITGWSLGVRHWAE